MRKIKRASATLEAALVMPLLLTTVLLMFYMTIHVHNAAAAALHVCETAISGKDRALPALPFLPEAESFYKAEDGETLARCRIGTSYFSGQTLWESEAEARYRVVHPVRLSYLARGAKRIGEGLSS